MKPMAWIGAMIMLGLLAGCGGSGGGVATSPSVRLIVSNTLRTFINGSEYFSQTASGAKNTYGNSTAGWITQPASGFVPTIISPIITPNRWAITFTQQNGDTTTSQISAIGKVNITTGMGVFETFKYQTNSTTMLAAGGSRVSTTITYVVPAIGPVKMTINQTATDALGAVSTSQFTLTASTTNIPF